MATPRRNARGATIAMIGFWLVAGCAGRAFEYHSHNEIPTGAVLEARPAQREYQEFIEWRIWKAGVRAMSANAKTPERGARPAIG